MEDISAMVCEAVGVVKEYLDNTTMNPLRNYLKKRRKCAKSDINAMYRKEQLTGKDIIKTKHAFSKYELFKNGWVIHFTNKPFEIIRNGFIGIPNEDIDYIYRSYGIDLPRRHDDSYAFAYDVEDNFNIEYGDYAIMFRTSGLKVFNRCGDNDWQVVFNPPNANMKECFILRLEKTSGYDGFDDIGEPSYVGQEINGVDVINPYTKKSLYNAKSLESAIDWIKTNYRQYKSANAFNHVHKMKDEFERRKSMANDIVEFIKTLVNGKCIVTNIGHLGQIEVTVKDTEEYVLENVKRRFGFTKCNKEKSEEYDKHYKNGVLEIAYTPESSKFYRWEELFNEHPKGLCSLYISINGDYGT